MNTLEEYKTELEVIRDEIKEKIEGYKKLHEILIKSRDEYPTHSVNWNFFAGKRSIMAFVVQDLEELLK